MRTLFCTMCTWSLLAVLGGEPARAAPTQPYIPVEVARDMASAALERCRSQGFAVTVAVLGRAGETIALLHDNGAGPHTIDIAQRKAFTALTFHYSTSEFAAIVAKTPGGAQLAQIDRVWIVPGGVPVRVGDQVIGGIGVSGSPGGDKDEACAMTGLSLGLSRLR